LVELIVNSNQKPHFSQRTREMGHPVYFGGFFTNRGCEPAVRGRVCDGWTLAGLRISSTSKAPLLAKDARNGAPSLF